MTRRRRVIQRDILSYPVPTLKALREWKRAGTPKIRQSSRHEAEGPRQHAAAQGATWTLRRANVGRSKKTGRFVSRSR